MQQISWLDFEKVELRVGTIVEVVDFPQAKKPAYKLKIDLGPDLGIKDSSAQITVHYQKHELIDKQVVCVVNFPSKQIGPFISQVLTTGFTDQENAIVLCVPDRLVPNGVKLC
ncbi:MAG TPA: tRNA-binding protein [Patescibacteria group bacterium]|jgi:tRNA-binding protein|nr:tRNA-binding protein [Patescibacteria group bacterium]